MDLFSSVRDVGSEPLASRMRPRTMDEFVGQEHILGPGRLLRRAIQADQLSSIIFYGPPGSGKTTLAMVIANTTKSRFLTLNAVLSGVKELRDAVESAKKERELYNRRTTLFVDEVHRWNKAQQDALLPWVENGTIILIGATTLNPFFEVIPALVSRSRIFQLKSLTEEDLFTIARMTLSDKERGYGKYFIEFEEGALEHLVRVAGGDARSLLNALELAVETTPERFPPPEGERIFISKEAAEESIQKKVVLYDKEGDYHFDTISAFIKSLRGSDPDAALYWLARMVNAGEDPKFIFRRMLILASEDVGMADPNALIFVEAATSAFERVGMPEGRFHLAHAAIYLATAPKSNSTMGFFDALKTVEEESKEEIPKHLKDSSRDKEGFGHGEGYIYPHAYREHWVAQQYLPAKLQGRIFYQPSEQGYESGIREEVRRRREIQLEAALPFPEDEVLTFSPPDKNLDKWLNRLAENRSEILTDIRKRIFDNLDLRRHDRILDINARTGLLSWEAFRRVPEGGVWGLVPDKDNYELLTLYASTLPEPERPILINKGIEEFTPGNHPRVPEDILFEAVIGRDTLPALSNKERMFKKIHSLISPGGTLSIAETVPRKAPRLSEFIMAGIKKENERTLIEKFKTAEEEIYNDPSDPLINWDENDLIAFCKEAGFGELKADTKTYTFNKYISTKDLRNWFAIESRQGKYAGKLLQRLKQEELKRIGEIFFSHLENTPVEWRKTVLFLCAKRK
ncbi:MAG: AAA family ATPase [Spirochaetes bacterium]|nr:MAG: AAA family ATPase [Spirochaetota bacterium]